MAGRIRTVKPELFTHEQLYDLEASSGLPLRLALIGLLTQADREGRFRWQPRRLKLAVLPYDEGVDFAAVLDALHAAGIVGRYCANGEDYGWFITWERHQRPNSREAASELPPPQQGAGVSHPYATGGAQQITGHSEGEGCTAETAITGHSEGEVCTDAQPDERLLQRDPGNNGETRAHARETLAHARETRAHARETLAHAHGEVEVEVEVEVERELELELEKKCAAAPRDFFAAEKNFPAGDEGNPPGGTDAAPAGGDVFDQFWDSWPSRRRRDKRRARAAWKAAVKRLAANPDQPMKPEPFLLAAARRYAASPLGQSEYVKMPATWLNADGWDDEPQSWEAAADPRGTRSLLERRMQAREETQTDPPITDAVDAG